MSVLKYNEEISMKRTQQLSTQRDLFKQQINGIIENTFPARMLQIGGLPFQRLTRSPNQPPWYISTFILGVLAILPQTIIAIALKDPGQIVGTNGLPWSISTEVMVLFIPLSYFLLKYILTTLRDLIIDGIQEKENIDELGNFLSGIGEPKNALSVVVIVSIFWSLLAIPILSSGDSGFIGLGISIDVWIGACTLGLMVYLISWFMQFPGQLGKYQYKLYRLDPARSEIIENISNLFSRPFLAGAFFQAIFILGISFFKVAFIQTGWIFIFALLVVWIPLIVHFINSQVAINKIIALAKWQTLNELQEEIHQQFSNSRIYATENIESINKLMDLYERLYNTHNSRLGATRVLGLLNQLILPLLASIISGYESFLELFNR